MVRSGRRWNKAWVIGASSGIGRQVAIDLAEHCGTVCISARRADKLDELISHYRNIVSHPLDVTDTGAVAAAAAAIDSDDDPLDLVVISSGYWKQTKVPDFEPEVFRKTMQVNFLGAINVLDAVTGAMGKRGNGRIAIVASVAGYRGLPNAAAYGSSKAALINLVESVRVQMERLGVQITIINPGFVDTRLTEVNSFPMPFMLAVEPASRRIVDGLIAGKYEIAFPRRLAWPLKILRVLPHAVFFWIVRNFILGSRRTSRKSQ